MKKILGDRHKDRVHDFPGEKVVETKSDSMQLYSIFAKHMVIAQEKKDSTGMSWDDKDYELSVTSNKPQPTVKSKNLQFYDKVISFELIKNKLTGEFIWKSETIS